MKFLKIIIYTLSSLLFSFASLQAQGDLLERDIRIGEGILSELFSDNGQHSFPFHNVNSNSISGEYIPEYGVHFILGENILGHASQNSKSRQTGSNDSGQNLSASDVLESKITEYLTQYAPSIRGLQKNDHIRVSHGVQPYAHRFITYYSNESHNNPKIPRISYWVKYSDLQQYKEGNLSEQQLKNRIQKTDLDKTPEMRDLNIFSAVLETAINSPDLEHIRVNRKPVFSYFPEMGVHFHLNASVRGGFPFQIYDLEDFEFDFSSFDTVEFDKNISFHIEDSIDAPFDHDKFEDEMESLDITLDSLRTSIPAMLDSLKIALPEIRSTLSEIFEPGEDAPGPEQLEAEKETVTALVLETLADYGKTLTSLPDEELILISIHWRGSRNLPRQTIIRISKEDLLLGREPAIKELSRR